MENTEKRLAVCISATKSYLYAWEACIRGITSAVSHYNSGHFIYAGDKSKECKAAAEFLKFNLPENWSITFIDHDIPDDVKSYDKDAQLTIAKLQGSTFHKARQLKCDLCLSVESDVLLKADSLKILEWALELPRDGVHYDVAAGTYPNSGPLLGFGTPQNPIAEDFLPYERVLPPRLKLVYEENEKRIASFNGKTDSKFVEKEYKRKSRIHAKSKKYPQDGNIFNVMAKYPYRRRGWLENAMPGCVAHSFECDWCGLGVTLLSKRALALAEFNGYDGAGTQDLFLCWRKWYPRGIKIIGVPEVWCDHIKKRSEGIFADKFEHMIAYRETEGEMKGHMRIRAQEWIPL